MKKYIYCVLFSAAIFSCSSNDNEIQAPSEVSNISVHSIVGGAVIKWDIPAESNFSYVEVQYEKNHKLVVEKVSVFTDSLVVNGLINKEPLSFSVTTVNEVPGNRSQAGLMTTEVVTPLKRAPEITYFQNDLTKLVVTASMIDTYTQQSNEGPKENLVDGDPTTFWHTAYSGTVGLLPHWIQLNFSEPKTLGAIKFWFRQNNGDTDGRPSQWGLEVSNDGQAFTRVWESLPNLPVTNVTGENKLNFDKNYTSRYFRVMILKNGGKTYTHLGEISFFSMGERIVDKEKEAEDNYYNY